MQPNNQWFLVCEQGGNQVGFQCPFSTQLFLHFGYNTVFISYLFVRVVDLILPSSCSIGIGIIFHFLLLLWICGRSFFNFIVRLVICPATFSWCYQLTANGSTSSPCFPKFWLIDIAIAQCGRGYVVLAEKSPLPSESHPDILANKEKSKNNDCCMLLCVENAHDILTLFGVWPGRAWPSVRMPFPFSCLHGLHLRLLLLVDRWVNHSCPTMVCCLHKYVCSFSASQQQCRWLSEPSFQSFRFPRSKGRWSGAPTPPVLSPTRSLTLIEVLLLFSVPTTSLS